MMRFSSYVFLLSSLLFTLVLSQNKTQNTIDRESAALAFVVYPKIFDGILADRLETPIQFRALMYLNIATWNAWCNYHPTAADIFGRTRFKRPAKEHTRENKNEAATFSMLRMYEASPQSFGGPSAIPSFKKLMRDMGYDPDDTSEDMTTAAGIGNRAGRETGRLMKIDGWNSEGDRTASRSNYIQPFADYTGYVPKNDPWKIRSPLRWQPLLENNGRGFFFRQEHVSPYAGSAIAFTLSPKEVRSRRVSSPYSMKSLRREARRVFRMSARLTERQGLLAEYFDNKATSFKTEEDPIGVGSIAAAFRFFMLGPALDLDLDGEIIYGMGANFATFDSMVTVFKEKRRIDAIRPTGQTMRYLFGDRKFRVWGGPGKKPVVIKAGEWLSYIRTMPHSEFPSASACSCTALVEHALVNTKGMDVLPYSFTVPKGASKFYPGKLPSKDTTFRINRLTEWGRLCSESRLWAGVHFRPAVKAGERLCKGVGRGAQEFVDKLVAGKLDGKWLKWLPKDTEKFWEEP